MTSESTQNSQNDPSAASLKRSIEQCNSTSAASSNYLETVAKRAKKSNDHRLTNLTVTTNLPVMNKAPGADSPRSVASSTTSSTSAVRTPWTRAEDHKLTIAIHLHGARNWKFIASHVETRSPTQCLQRWNKVLKPGLKKGAWTSEEDELLVKFVETSNLLSGYEKIVWNDVNGLIEGRTVKQCRERWLANLDPNINKGEWTAEEDAILLSNQKRLGNRWAYISTLLKGRTEHSVKTRFRSLMRANKRQWSTAEDQLLLSLHHEMGSDWSRMIRTNRFKKHRTKNALMVRFKQLSSPKSQSSTTPNENAPSTSRIVTAPKINNNFTAPLSNMTSASMLPFQTAPILYQFPNQQPNYLKLNNITNLVDFNLMSAMTQMYPMYQNIKFVTY